MAFGLLASMCWWRIVMRRLRTHFEQVPLAVAKKILADELKKKQAWELAQGPGIKNWKRPAQKNRGR
jgi:hypothetical protein